MAVLQSISTDDIISNRMARLVTIWNNYDPPNAAQYDVGGLEFDPIKINQELNAFFELLVRDRVNQACRAITLAFAIGSDLDAIGSRYPYGVPRLQYDALGNALSPDQIAAGAVVASSESDNAYRTRLWLSPSILSLNGPGQGTFESYVFWALSAPMFAGELPLKHATALTTPGTGVVTLPIMQDNSNPVTATDVVTGNLVTTDNGDPAPTANQIEAVYEYITDPGFARKGLTDVLQVVRPKVFHTNITVTYQLFPGVDNTVLEPQIMGALTALVQNIRWIGADLTIMSIENAMAQAGVYNCVISSPTADVIVDQTGVVKVDTITLGYTGTGE
jgi:phage-related baseplate assembly protein